MDLVYGIVFDGKFHSNRMERKLRRNCENGIYAMDMDCDDFEASMSPANITEATKFFRRKSKLKVIRGVSYHDGLVPQNPVKYAQVPIHVHDAVYDEWEEIETVILRNGVCYFLQIVETQNMFALMDAREAFENEEVSLENIKGITPEIRVTYMFHVMERERQRIIEERERKKKELEVPINAIRHAMETNGALVSQVRKVNLGYEVTWEMHGHRIQTLLGKDYEVIHGGFCMSGGDKTQSAQSLVNVLDDYIHDGDYIHITRT